MKKLSIIIFSILTLLTPVFFANAVVPNESSNQKVTITQSNLTTNSVNLTASNLNTNTQYEITLTDTNSRKTISKTFSALAYDNGQKTISFTGLTPNTDYAVSVLDLIQNIDVQAGSSSVITKKEVVVVPITINPVNNTTGISATLSIKGLSEGTSFGVYVLKKSDNSVINSLNGTVSNGVASVQATGLVPGITYKILLNDKDGKQLATNEFIALPVTGKLSVVNSNTDITSNSIILKVEISLSNIPYFVNIYKKGETTTLDFKQGTSSGTDSVIFSSKLIPNTTYTTSLFIRGNEAKSLSDYNFTTNQLTGATVNTYDLKSTSASLEFHNLPVGKKFTAFIKADSDNGNTTGFYASSSLTPTAKTGDIVYADNFTGLTPGSLYVGGIVGDISVPFKTPLTDIVGVDYSILDKTITTATDLIANSKEGTSTGQYPVGSISILNTALQKTKTDYEFIKNNSQTETVDAIQSRVNSDVAELQTAIDIFKAKIIGGTSNPQTPSQKPGLFSKGGGLIPECPTTGCSFNELMQLINNVIKFLLFTIATPLAALGIIYAGWLYLSAGGNTENTTKAKKILTNIIIGYIIALAAWLIVNTILKSLGLDPSINTFLK